MPREQADGYSVGDDDEASVKAPTFAPFQQARHRLHDGEPYFLIAGHDALAVDHVRHYGEACREVASMVEVNNAAVLDIDALAVVSGHNLRRLVGDVDKGQAVTKLKALADCADAMAAYMTAWQQAHPDLVKLPD